MTNWVFLGGIVAVPSLFIPLRIQLRQDLSQIVDNFTLLDILSKEERDLVLESKIDSIKRKNEERMRRHQVKPLLENYFVNSLLYVSVLIIILSCFGSFISIFAFLDKK